MPKYTSYPDLISLLSDREIALLTSDDVEREESVEYIVNEYLAAAESLVESAIGNRYVVPFRDPLPEVIRMAILIIAKYRLFLRRGFVEDAIQQDYRDQVDFLRGVRAGEFDLPVGEGGRELEVRSGFGELKNMEFFHSLFD